MRLDMLDQVRVSAGVTGVALALVYFGATFLDLRAPVMLPMLVMAIGGFELALFGQDIWLKRKRRHG